MRRYRTIVGDPPWPFHWRGGPGGRRANPTEIGYALQTYEWISQLPIAPMAEDDATLFLWTTQDALHCGSARLTARCWGFGERVGEIIWRKPNFGAGALPRIGHETCVIYKRGSGSLRADAPRDIHSVQTWKQPYTNNGGKTHSAKPEGLCDLIERGHRGPYLELFARRARFGWDYWGDQSLSTATVEEAA